MRNSLSIDKEREVRRIEKFIQDTLARTKKRKLTIACSGGVDSSVAAALCVRAVGARAVRILLLPYGTLNNIGLKCAKTLIDFLEIPSRNIETVNITPSVDTLAKMLALKDSDQVRLGNIMARVRMVILYDLAKKQDALVCGTENKSEYFLGYFTRFGDEASDFEPIRHLYKTQVYQLASYLGLSDEIVKQPPTAGLWKGQTDEGEFGFSYREADQVLHLYYDQKIKLSEIENKFPNTKKIISLSERNNYKHHVPYVLIEGLDKV